MKLLTLVGITLALMVAAVPATAKQGQGANELPPGLQKKMERGQPLPPGWQKKLNYRKGDYLAPELFQYARVRDLGDGRQRLEVEDRVYTIIKDTREIIDILNQ